MDFKIVNERGALLVNVMALVALISLISAAVLTSIGSYEDKKEGVVFDGGTVSLIAEQITSLVENEGAWYKTVLNDTNLNCLLTNGVACSAVYEPFDLYLPDNTIFSKNSDGSGFDKNGFKCNAYSSISPDSRCVYKVKLYWKCDSSPCVSAKSASELMAKTPKIKIKIEYFYNSSVDHNTTELALNHKDLDFVRGGNQTGLKAFCDSIAAELTAGGLRCRFNPPAAENCRSMHSGHMVKELKNGHVTCKNPTGFGDGTNPFRCNPGTAMTGFINDHPSCDVF